MAPLARGGCLVWPHALVGVTDPFGLLGRFGRGLGSMEFGGSPSGSPDMSMSSPRDFLDDGSDGNVFDVESDGDVFGVETDSDVFGVANVVAVILG